MLKRVIHRLRAFGRRLQPPGNRESLETSYRQPSMDPEHTPSSWRGASQQRR